MGELDNGGLRQLGPRVEGALLGWHCEFASSIPAPDLKKVSEMVAEMETSKWVVTWQRGYW